MATKTYYPLFHHFCQQLNTFLGEHSTDMVARTGMAGATDTGGVLYTDTLTSLTNALNRVLINWPSYKELP